MKQDVKKVGMVQLSLAIAFILAYSVCAVPCAQQVEETSTETKFTNVKDGMEVLKRFVQTRCWRVPNDSRASAEELKDVLTGIVKMESYVNVINTILNTSESLQNNTSESLQNNSVTLTLFATILQQVINDTYTWIDTFEPSIPSPSCNIPTFLDFDPLAAGIALDLFDSVDTSSHFLERYESTSSNIPTWINRTIPDPELQCHLCELTCGISCSEDCESL